MKTFNHFDREFIVLVIITVVLFFLLSCCKPYRYLDNHHAEICNECIDEYVKTLPMNDTITHKTDTITKPGIGLTDDYYQHLLFRCDSLNQVQLYSISLLSDSLKSELSHVVPIYIFEHGKLTVNLKVYQDSIRFLQDKITTIKREVKIITPPATIIYKTPIWVYVVGGIAALLIIACIVVASKLKS